MTSGKSYDEDEERTKLRSEMEESTLESEPRSTPRKAVLSTAGILLMAGCAALLFNVSAWKKKPITARELLESAETTEIITENLISLGHHGLPKEAMRARVASLVHDRMKRLRNEEPKAYSKLESKQLSPERKDAALRRLRSMGDPRIRSIQKDIMAAIKDTVQESGDHEALKRHLFEKMQPRVAEMRQLRDAYFPTVKLANKPEDFDRIRLVKYFDRWIAQRNAKVAADREVLAPARKLDEEFDFDHMEESIQDMMDDMDDDLGSGDDDEDDESIFDGDNVPSCTNPKQCGVFTCAQAAAFDGSTKFDTCMEGLVDDALGDSDDDD